MRITVFCEDSNYMKNVEGVNKVYPKGLGQTIADVFGKSCNFLSGIHLSTFVKKPTTLVNVPIILPPQ